MLNVFFLMILFKFCNESLFFRGTNFLQVFIDLYFNGIGNAYENTSHIIKRYQSRKYTLHRGLMYMQTLSKSC